MARVKVPVFGEKETTAWRLLLLFVKSVIREEPRRINMGVFGLNLATWRGNYIYPEPACKTVGCFAGWISIAAGMGIPMGQRNAWELLGDNKNFGGLINYNTVGEGRNRNVFNSGDGDACENTRPGTRAHARAVLARITRFMKVNEEALKARKLRKVRGKYEPVEA